MSLQKIKREPIADEHLLRKTEGRHVSRMPKNLSLLLEALGLVWYCLLGFAASDFSEIIKMLTKALWFRALHLGLSYNWFDLGV